MTKRLSRNELLERYKDSGTSKKKRKSSKRNAKTSYDTENKSNVIIEGDNEEWKVNNDKKRLDLNDTRLRTSEIIAVNDSEGTNLQSLIEREIIHANQNIEDDIASDISENEIEQNNLKVGYGSASNVVENKSNRNKLHNALETQLKYEWSTGKADRARRIAEKKEFDEIKAEKFSRYEDDEKINKELKNKLRDGDPMSNFLSQKNHDNEQRKNKKKSKSKKGASENLRPTYSGRASAPNRFGILPGFRWDGIDRSNGFEEEYLEAINSRAARKRDKFKSETADM